MNDAKVELSERGLVWWSDGTPDLNRRMAAKTPYAEWFEGLPDQDLEAPKRHG